MAISKAQKSTTAKKRTAAESNTQFAPQARKRLQATASMLTTSKRAMIEDSDEEEEPGHVGETLSPNEDAIMELANSESDRGSTGSTGDSIQLTDAKDAEEDEDSEISKHGCDTGFSCRSKLITRATYQRMDGAGLCILQSHSTCGIHQRTSLP
jgi:hypothetical protein